MRRMLRILGWMGMGISALLFAATVVLWMRSLGHQEWWRFDCFEPNPQWKTEPLAGRGTWRRWSLGAIHGRLWLGSETRAPAPDEKSQTPYRRQTITADRTRQDFERYFQPCERPWEGGVEHAWRFAGAGFRHLRSAIHPQTGRPEYKIYRLAIPFWMPAVLFGLWPTLFVVRRLLRRKRYAKGLCPNCGYDLRATPDRCPECGREVVANCD